MNVVKLNNIGMSPSGKALDFDSSIRQFKSGHPSQKILVLRNEDFFIQAAGLVYHHDAVVHIISPFGSVSHHALACILLRLDDIQHYVLMICNSLRN